MAAHIQFYNETTENITDYERQVREAVAEAVKQEGLSGQSLECSYIFVDDDRIRQINAQYRQKDRVTDVITFAMEDEMEGQVQIIGAPMPRMLGDVFLSLPRTRQQALDYGHSFERELSFLAIHGFLHLLGYDHLVPEEEKIMFEKQEVILNALGIRR